MTKPRWASTTASSSESVEEDYRKSHDLAVAHVERERIAEWLCAGGMIDIDDIRSIIEPSTRRALADAIKQGKYRSTET